MPASEFFAQAMRQTGNIEDSLRMMCDSAFSMQETVDAVNEAGYPAIGMCFLDIHGIQIGPTFVGWINKTNFRYSPPQRKVLEVLAIDKWPYN